MAKAPKDLTYAEAHRASNRLRKYLVGHSRHNRQERMEDGSIRFVLYGPGDTIEFLPEDAERYNNLKLRLLGGQGPIDLDIDSDEGVVKTVVVPADWHDLPAARRLALAAAIADKPVKTIKDAAAIIEEYLDTLGIDSNGDNGQ